MKIAITTSAKNLADKMESALDLRFGRAQSFVICDMENNSLSLIDNTQNLNSMQGAGIQSAQTVANLGVEAIITGHCGPKAFSVLKTAGVKIYTAQAGTIAQAIKKFKNNELTEAQDADVNGHWA